MGSAPALVPISQSYHSTHPDLPWFALHVRCRHERIVEESLTGKGYAVLAPSYRVRRKRADRTVEVEESLFPGYLFCQFDPRQRLPVLKTPGLVRVVGTRTSPEPVDELEIASIRAIVNSGRPVQPWPYLRAGHRVRIEAGPLAGASGVLVSVKNDTRLVASVTLMQRSVAVEIDRDIVTPVY